MKKTLRMILPLAAFFTLALAACSKDDDKKDEGRNFLKIGDNETEIVGGVLTDYGIENGVYNSDLTLYTKGISNVNGEPSGKGNVIYFEIYTTASSGVAAGKYTFANDGKAGTFSRSSGVVEGADSADQDAGKETEITAGTLEVKRDGGNYEFTFTCTGKDGRAVSGRYKGTVEKVDPK